MGGCRELRHLSEAGIEVSHFLAISCMVARELEINSDPKVLGGWNC